MGPDVNAYTYTPGAEELESIGLAGSAIPSTMLGTKATMLAVKHWGKVMAGLSSGYGAIDIIGDSAKYIMNSKPYKYIDRALSTDSNAEHAMQISIMDDVVRSPSQEPDNVRPSVYIDLPHGMFDR